MTDIYAPGDVDPEAVRVLAARDLPVWLFEPEKRTYRAAFLLGARVARALRMRGRVARRAAESVARAAVPLRGPELFQQDDEVVATRRPIFTVFARRPAP